MGYNTTQKMVLLTITGTDENKKPVQFAMGGPEAVAFLEQEQISSVNNLAGCLGRLQSADGKAENLKFMGLVKF
jgi:hypothetical protein